MRTGTSKVLRMGSGCQEECGGPKPLAWRRPQRNNLRWELASAAGEKPSVSLSLFLEVDNLEIQHEPGCAATSVWTGQWEDDVRDAWKRQVLRICIVDKSQRASRSSLL